MEQSNKIIQRENEERYGRRKTTTHVSHGGTLPPTSSGDDDNNDVLTLIAKSRLALMLLLLFWLWELLLPTKLYWTQTLRWHPINITYKNNAISKPFLSWHTRWLILVVLTVIVFWRTSNHIHHTKKKKDVKSSLSFFKLEIEWYSEYNN